MSDFLSWFHWLIQLSLFFHSFCQVSFMNRKFKRTALKYKWFVYGLMTKHNIISMMQLFSSCTLECVLFNYFFCMVYSIFAECVTGKGPICAFSVRGCTLFWASSLDINGCVWSYFEGTANVHCYTSCTLTNLYCSKVSFFSVVTWKYK